MSIAVSIWRQGWIAVSAGAAEAVTNAVTVAVASGAAELGIRRGWQDIRDGGGRDVTIE